VQDLQWKQAKTACCELGKGWRLPTRQELDSIVDHSKDFYGDNWSSPTLNTNIFPDSSGWGYWTSDNCYSDAAWVISFYNGNHLCDYKRNFAMVRCVKDARLPWSK
jgi:hypothetical protein